MNSAMRMGKLSGKGGAAMDGLGDYFPFWNALTKAQRDRLAAAARERGYSKGAMLHRGGADAEYDALFQSYLAQYQLPPTEVDAERT